MYSSYITNIFTIIGAQGTMPMELTLNLLVDIVALLLAFFVLLDMVVDKGRKANPIDRKTDWYFKNEKYDEELKARDQREDTNEYKFY